MKIKYKEIVAGHPVGEEVCNKRFNYGEIYPPISITSYREMTYMVIHLEACFRLTIQKNFK